MATNPFLSGLGTIQQGLDSFVNMFDPTMRARRTLQAEQAELMNPLREQVLNMTARQQPFAGMPRGDIPPPMAQTRSAGTQPPPGLAPPPEIDAVLQQAAQRHGVPVNVLRVLAAQESSFNPSAYNQPTPGDPTDPGATGLFQFTEATARDMGIDPRDPMQAADATARMLRRRLDAGESLEDAMTAHFGGDDRSYWGPKTAQYREDVLGKLAMFEEPTGQPAADPVQRGPFGTVLGPVPADQSPVAKLLASYASDPKLFAQNFAGPDGMKALQAMLSGGQGDPQIVAKGAALVSPTGQELYRNVEAPGNVKSAIVMSGDTPQGAALGIPPGERARVELERNDAGLVVNQSVKGKFGGGDTNVTVNTGGDKYVEANAKTINDEVAADLEAGRAAQNSLATLDQAQRLLAGGINVGRGQAMVLPLRQLAADFGVPLDEAAAKIGVNLGTLADQEEFNRLTTQLMLDSFQQFKGNLNQTEVQMAQDSVANIGTSEEANRRAIAAMRAAAELAIKRRQLALQAQGLEGARNYLIGKSGADTSEFQALFDKHLQAMGGGRAEQPTIDRQQQAPSGAPAVGTVEDGYRYNGGDPGNPSSWTRVQ